MLRPIPFRFPGPSFSAPRIYNNNYYMGQPYMPWCGGGCNGLSKWFGIAALVNVFNSSLSSWRNNNAYQDASNFYPEISFSPEAYLTGYDLNQMNKLYGDYFNISQISDKFYAISKDSTVRLSGATITELMDAINTYITENPDFIKKTKKDTGDDDDVDDVDDVDSDPEVDDKDKKDDPPNTDPTPAPKADPEVTTTKELPKDFTRASLQTNNKVWKVVYDKEKLTAHKGADSAAEYIANLYTEQFSKQELIDLLIEKNPEVFDSDGNLAADANLDDLVIPQTTFNHLNALGLTSYKLTSENDKNLVWKADEWTAKQFDEGTTAENVLKELKKSYVLANTSITPEMIIAASYGAFDEDGKLVDSTKLKIPRVKNEGLTFDKNTEAFRLNGGATKVASFNLSSSNDAQLEILVGRFKGCKFEFWQTKNSSKWFSGDVYDGDDFEVTDGKICVKKSSIKVHYLHNEKNDETYPVRVDKNGKMFVTIYDEDDASNEQGKEYPLEMLIYRL